jgi:hypothetical protein
MIAAEHRKAGAGLHIIGPSGIGDVSWLVSALWSVRAEIGRFDVLDGYPYRTVPYLEHLGFGSAYDKGLTYPMIQQFEQVHGYDAQAAGRSWSRITSLGTATVPLECNRWLELGRRLDAWLPDIPCDFHYQIPQLPEHTAGAARVIARAMAAHPMSAGPVVGISCASYRGSEAWKTWGRDDWVDCLRRVMQLGWRPLVLGGAWDDLSYAVACELELPDIVGKTSVPEMIEVLRWLDSYIGFSSGLNVIRTVLDRPAFALWPDFQQELSTSWAPQHMLDSRRYIASLWRPVEHVWPVMRAYLRRCEAERSVDAAAEPAEPPAKLNS